MKRTCPNRIPSRGRRAEIAAAVEDSRKEHDERSFTPDDSPREEARRAKVLKWKIDELRDKIRVYWTHIQRHSASHHGRHCGFCARAQGEVADLEARLVVLLYEQREVAA